MSAGFEVTNSNNIILVDENYINLAVVASGVVSDSSSSQYTMPGGGAGSGGNAAKYYDINYTAQADGGVPILALYKLGSGAHPAGVTLNGASYNSSTHVWNFRVLIFCPVGMTGDASFQYYIFDRPPTQSSGWGAEVFNSSGKLVFSAAYYPLKIVSFGANNSLPGGKKYAFINRNGVNINEQDQTISDSHGGGTIIFQWEASFNSLYSTATGVVGVGGTFDAGQGTPSSYIPAANEGYYDGTDGSPDIVIDVTNI